MHARRAVGRALAGSAVGVMVGIGAAVAGSLPILPTVIVCSVVLAVIAVQLR